MIGHLRMAENHQADRFPPSISYTVSFPDARRHYAKIEAVLPVEGRAEVEIFLPVWTPGSYLVREYARNLESLAAHDLALSPLPVEKSRKNRWRITTAGTDRVLISYRLYCREMSVRTNWVEDAFALINGAPTFVAVGDAIQREYRVRFELPPHWSTTVTGLTEAPDGPPHSYIADSYDTLIDSPVLCGNPAVYTFEVNGVPHLLANEGEAGVWNGPASAADIEHIVREHATLWRGFPQHPPFRKYVFLNLLTEAGGGLEHHNSVCLMTSRWATRTPKAYLRWLGLVSHEYFHVWNVKRLRPIELGPFDYENENYTRSLWIAEGITEYYAPLTVRRAGLCTAEQYLEALSEMIRLLQTTPGRLAQSLEQSSWDAWIKLYRPDENSINSSISYYVKGAVVAWLLDARIRRATSGFKSLDDLMRLAFSRFGGERGFTPAEFKSLASEISGEDLTRFFARHVESSEELDYTEALDWFGLRFKATETEATAWMGAETKIDGGRLVITKVPHDTPAADAGLSADDEIIALDSFRVRPDQLSQRLENYRPGDRLSLLFARRDLIQTVDLTLGRPPRNWQLELLSAETTAQQQNRNAWLRL